ncbi:SDR family NAD(P)-dependent oxidoreductase [uncultured Ellagibacter sp.]|uniref:SDR family NAD(P)-dependent oxidoreductase n=1 Tax=uncultured Ellagibacter sp. TaxID=2137580 RepID=UPI002601A0A2|nr:SDR family oxidoreductase [uncultured Ellagibacter sp.]
MEMQRFVDKVALVTGGANGFGRGLTEQLVKEGAKVVIFDIEDDTMEEVFGGNDDVVCMHCDVRDYDRVQECVKEIIERFGRIDILMNNAGTVCRQSFLECTKEGWLEVIDTNLNGVFYVAQAVARTMVELGVQGHILNVSSNSSRTTISNVTPYPPSKSAVKMLTQTMARELAEYGIHVNAIAPGTSLTRITLGTRNDPERNAAFLAKMPFHRYGEIREMVDVSLFLCSEAASFITGETIYEDGGFNLQ